MLALPTRDLQRPTGLTMVTPASDMPSSRHVEFNNTSQIARSVSGLSDCRMPAWSMLLLPTCDGRGGMCQREVRKSIDERYLGWHQVPPSI